MSRDVTLAQLLREGIGSAIRGDTETVVRGVHHDSREVEPGDLFVSMARSAEDGAKFVQDAMSRGAVAVLGTPEVLTATPGVPGIVAEAPRACLARAAAVVYGHPTFALEVVGITGTNGKTTTTFLVEQALVDLGAKPALLGTVVFRAPGVEREAPFTTPEGDEIARFARTAADAGATHLVMEVSSHGIAQARVDAVHFRVAAFTNLTQDHLDFHGTMEAYGATKARLFEELGPGAAVVNVDDPFGAQLASRLRVPLWRVSQRKGSDADLRVIEATIDRSGIDARVLVRGREVHLRSPLFGAHNLENLLVALGCGVALDYDAKAFAEALSRAAGAPGRLERLDDPRGVAVLVDYAHSPDALERALAAVRALTPGRVIVVFGCGGDRDRGKRPQMGSAAGRGADLVVATTDNPRTEAPDAILREVVPGIVATDSPRLAPGSLAEATRGFVVVEDRRDAITAALRAARSGDTVLIAGKGHEPYQIIGREKRPFDDRQVARSVIAALSEGAGSA